jgi:hypothetical protein
MRFAANVTDPIEGIQRRLEDVRAWPQVSRSRPVPDLLARQNVNVLQETLDVR